MSSQFISFVIWLGAGPPSTSTLQKYLGDPVVDLDPSGELTDLEGSYVAIGITARREADVRVDEIALGSPGLARLSRVGLLDRVIRVTCRRVWPNIIGSLSQTTLGQEPIEPVTSQQITMGLSHCTFSSLVGLKHNVEQRERTSYYHSHHVQQWPM